MHLLVDVRAHAPAVGRSSNTRGPPPPHRRERGPPRPPYRLERGMPPPHQRERGPTPPPLLWWTRARAAAARRTISDAREAGRREVPLYLNTTLIRFFFTFTSNRWLGVGSCFMGHKHWLLIAIWVNWNTNFPPPVQFEEPALATTKLIMTGRFLMADLGKNWQIQKSTKKQVCTCAPNFAVGGLEYF